MRTIRIGSTYLMLFIFMIWSLVLTKVVLADTGGRFRIPELPSGTTITINAGTAADPCSNAEWPAAGALTFTISPIAGGPSGTGMMFIKHPDDPLLDEELYLFIAVTDPTINTQSPTLDNLVFMFDLSHDHDVVSTVSFDLSDDRGLLFNRNVTVQRVFGQIINPTVDAGFSFPSSRRCIQEASASSWVFEAKILPEDLGLNSFNALMGAAVLVNDLNTGAAVRGNWPTTAAATPSTWANLITRQPIDYVLLIDQSGSMTGDKWSSAKQAGNNFALILSKMKDANLDSEFPLLIPALAGDRLGLATFSWTGGSDASTTIISLSTIPSSPGDYTGVLPVSPGGLTPIIGGINKTVDMFDNVGPLSTTPRTRIVMLLSDGMHNRPTSTIDLTTAGGFTYVPSPCGSNSLVRINTVAVGSDATVDTDKLDDIKDCFSGSRLTNIYNIADPEEPLLTAQLTKFFVETLIPYFRWNIVNDTGADFTLKAGERKLLLFAFWDNKGDAVPLSITKPDMTVATGTADATLGYSYLVLDNPLAENYTGFTATGASQKLVLVDLRVEARFAIDNQPHGTGSTITLKSRLREDGKPITGAEVRVDIFRPGEGFGTYVSTHTSQNCRPRPPVLPPIDRSRRTEFPIKTTVPPDPTSANTVDVPAPRFTLIEQLFKACEKNELLRITDPGLKLYDDGTHGDAIANDGFYTLSFINTQYEGSYIFRSRATGTTADGLSFSRINEIAEYVRVDIDPLQTAFDSRIYQQQGNLIVREFYITPRDSFGGYLGPGYSHQIQFLTKAGEWVSPIIDYNNGIYSQLLRYDESKDRPVVTATVQDEQLSPINAFKSFELVPFVGRFFFDNSLGLDDGTVVGARFGYHITNPLVAELEGGVTFTENTAGSSGNVYQAMLNLRYDLYPLRVRDLLPYVTAGAGYLFFRDLGINDEAFAFHGGAGLTYKLSDSIGIRVDGRVFRISGAMGAGATTNYQTTAGLVFWF